MSPASRRRARRFVLLLSVLVVVSGCGSRTPAPLGDPGGVALEVTIDFTWQYLDTMSQWRPAPESTAVVIAPDPLWIGLPYGLHLHSRFGRGYGYGSGWRGGFAGPVFGYYEVGYPDPGYQNVFLLAGDGPAEAQLFHQRLRPGRHHFRVFIRPGRTVTLSVQAVGNREGWVVIGHFTSADRDGGRLHIELDAEGSALQAYPPPEVAGAAPVDPPSTSSPAPAPASGSTEPPLRTF